MVPEMVDFTPMKTSTVDLDFPAEVEVEEQETQAVDGDSEEIIRMIRPRGRIQVQGLLLILYMRLFTGSRCRTVCILRSRRC